MDAPNSGQLSFVSLKKKSEKAAISSDSYKGVASDRGTIQLDVALVQLLLIAVKLSQGNSMVWIEVVH